MEGPKKFFPSSFGAVVGSGIRDPRWDSGWKKIRIRDKHPGSAALPSISITLTKQRKIQIKND